MTAAPAADSTTGHDRARQRYGSAATKPPSMRTAAIVVGVIAAVVAGWMVWGELRPSASAEVGRFVVVSDAEVAMVVQVTRPIGSTAVCTVEALGDGFAQVGLKDVTFEPAQTALSEVEITMATSAPATVAVIRGCQVR